MYWTFVASPNANVAMEIYGQLYFGEAPCRLLDVFDAVAVALMACGAFPWAILSTGGNGNGLLVEKF